MLKFIITEDKQGLVWGTSRQKQLDGVLGEVTYMNLEKIYVCACIWIT